MIFAPSHFLDRIKGFPQLLLCEAPKWIIEQLRYQLTDTDQLTIKMKL